MSGLEDKQLPNIPKDNDSLGGDNGLEGIPIPPNGEIEDPTFTELPDGNDLETTTTKRKSRIRRFWYYTR